MKLGKVPNITKEGEVFHSDCLIKINGKEFYSSSDKEDIYQAIDEIRESLLMKLEKIKIADKLYSDAELPASKKCSKVFPNATPLPRNTKC